jgi:hypothetical protein
MTITVFNEDLMHFSKIRLSADELQLLARAVHELNELCKKEYRLVTLMWNKYLGIRVGGMTMVSVTTNSRPPEGDVVAISDGSERQILLPTRRSSDFNRCCEILQLEATEDKERFQQFLTLRQPPRSR